MGWDYPYTVSKEDRYCIGLGAIFKTGAGTGFPFKGNDISQFIHVYADGVEGYSGHYLWEEDPKKLHQIIVDTFSHVVWRMPGPDTVGSFYNDMRGG